MINKHDEGSNQGDMMESEQVRVRREGRVVKESLLEVTLK